VRGKRLVTDSLLLVYPSIVTVQSFRVRHAFSLCSTKKEEGKVASSLAHSASLESTKGVLRHDIDGRALHLANRRVVVFLFSLLLLIDSVLFPSSFSSLLSLASLLLLHPSTLPVASTAPQALPSPSTPSRFSPLQNKRTEPPPLDHVRTAREEQ
jgi:hypothetical protein